MLRKQKSIIPQVAEIVDFPGRDVESEMNLLVGASANFSLIVCTRQ